ncbi:hypothetical protein CROQUDRAFT_654046, partial [Cronartium quercuum f. sp. fusiforme G11]
MAEKDRPSSTPSLLVHLTIDSLYTSYVTCVINSVISKLLVSISFSLSLPRTRSSVSQVND